MKLEKSVVDKVVLLKVSGSISFMDTSTLKSSLHRIAKDGKKQIVVDCANMDGLHSRAISIFLYAYKSIPDGQIAFANPNDHVRQIFYTAKLDEVFPVYDSVDEAIAAVKSSEPIT